MWEFIEHILREFSMTCGIFGGLSRQIQKRFATGVGWSLVAGVASQGATFATSVLIARVLGRVTYGEFGIVQSTMLTFGGVAQLAVGYTATKYVAEYRLVNKEKTGRLLGICMIATLITGSVASLLLFFAAPWVAADILRTPHLTSGLRIVAPGVMFAVLNGAQIGALAGFEGYRSMAFASAVHGITHFLICCILAQEFGLNGALTGLLVAGVARWALFNWGLRHEARGQEVRIRYRGSWVERRIFARFGLPAAIGGLSSMPAAWLGNAFLAKQTGGYAQFALYSAASSLKTAVMFLPYLVNNVGMSVLNNQRGNEDRAGYISAFWANAALTGCSVVFPAVGAALFGRWILRLYGAGFAEAYSVVVILLLAAIVEATSLAAYQVIQSQERMWLSLFLIGLPRDWAFVALAAAFVPRFGAFGLGLSYGLTWVSSGILVIIIARSIGFQVSRSRASTARA